MKKGLLGILSVFCLQFSLLGLNNKLPPSVLVGTCADNNPFEFYTIKNGKEVLTGFDIELCQLIAKQLNIHIVHKDFRFNGLLPAITTNSIQWAIAAITPTEERNQQVDFSIPYLKDSAALISLKEVTLQSVQGLNSTHVIGVQLGTTHENNARKQLTHEILLRSYPRVQEMVQDLRLKRISGVIVGESEAKKIVHLNSQLCYILLPWSDDKAIALPKHSPWLVRINKAIEALEKNGELSQLVQKWKVDPNIDDESFDSQKFHFEIIWPSAGYLLKGFLLNIQYVLCALFLGVCFGIILTVCRLSHFKLLNYAASFYVSVFRGTPLLLQLSLVYYAWPQLMNVRLSAFQAGVMAFSLNSGAYVSEILRSGFNGVPLGQWEAAKVLGIPMPKIWRDIVLPQAFRNSLPSLANEMIDLLKESALISVIGEADLLCRANQLASEHYLFFEPLILAACCYYIAVVLLSGGVKYLEKRMRIYASH